MNKNLIKKTIKQNSKVLYWYFVGLILYTWTLVALYPSMTTNSGYEEIIKNSPKELMSFFGYGEDFKMTFGSFIGGEYLSSAFPMIMIAYLASYFSRFFTKEVETGQIANLLSQPVSRTSIFLSRSIAGLFGALSIIVVSLGSLPIFAKLYDITLGWPETINLIIMAFMLFFAFSGLFAFFSVIVSDRGKALALSVGFFIVTFIWNGLSNLNETVKDYDFLSILKYFKPIDIVSGKDMDFQAIMIYAAVGLAGFALALIAFNKRDIPV